MIDIKQCPICKSENITIIKELEYRYPEKIEDYYRDKRLRIAFDKIAKCDRRGTLKYRVCRCSDCSLTYLNPRLTDEEVLIKYYWIVEGMGIEEPVKIVLDEGLSWIDRLREERMRRILERYVNPQSKTLLDFGGADGRMCINLRDKYDCGIVEITNYCLHEKLKYIGENLKACEGKEYDIILLIDVLEHMNKPLEFINILQKYLSKEKGIIIIAVPDAHNREWKAIREPLTHCNYFNQESLKKLTEIAGLKQLEMKIYPFPTFKGEKAIGQIFYIGKRE